MKAIAYRDLSYMKLKEKSYLWIACDSAGGIGDKKADVVFCPPEVLGYFTARVALLEMLCIGATPFLCIDNLAVEMKPTGEKIIEGIDKCLKEAGFHIQITGSTEENFSTVQTGMGLTLLGLSSDFKPPTVEQDAYCFCLGKPMIGNEVLSNPHWIAAIETVRGLLSQKGIYDAIPAGSKGLIHEIELLQRTHNIRISTTRSEVDVVASAGPATSVLFLGKKEIYEALQSQGAPVYAIGKVEG